MNKEDQKYLLQLARRTLEKHFQDKEILQIESDDLPTSLTEIKGVFVSLFKNEELRGCIGNLKGDQPIFQGVIENSLASALFDPRFEPLTEDELNNVKIEISVIEPMKETPKFQNLKGLLDYLNKNHPGILIKKEAFQATFLPQVWKELTTAEDLLSHLCIKAGLAKDEWKKMDLDIYEYKVNNFKE
ncbi:MAG: AmmeMemoRadiSam system protein A [Candidatus Pacebacteria bacterium]|nr:AmmeMemoRadiSam system protein A [Candidatus Paceibacterota bacterium]